MDYCSSCRRHLNGALVCPGCGAYAPDIAPPSHGHYGAAKTAMAWEHPPERFPASERYPGTPRFDAGPNGSGASEDVMAEAPGAGSASATADPAMQGRAARRRQMARWKKHRRRAAAATAFALVGGGLTIAALPNGASKGQSNAASAPESVTAATTRTRPVATASAQPDTPVARHPGNRPPTTGPHQRNTALAVPPPATTSAPPDTAPAANSGTQIHQAGITAPLTHTAATATPAPASTEGADAATSHASPAPTAPATPTPTPTQTAPSKRLCLLVVCLG
ncbi:SCO2400 family protein [Actinacidiphila soli]